MKFTLSWLKEHLDTDADAADHRRQADRHRPGSGKRHRSPAPALKDFIVGEVVTAEKHPNADKLRLCMVNDGDSDTVADRLRRAQCAGRHQGGAGAARHRHSRPAAKR